MHCVSNVTTETFLVKANHPHALSYGPRPARLAPGELAPLAWRIKSTRMAGPPFDPAYSQKIIPHVEAARCLTMAGFTVLVWDHICTIDEEIQFWWTAPRSVVKYLFLVNRYVTPIGQAVAVYYTSRWGLMSVGLVETISLAIWDLLLLFRVHALWGGRRSVVIGTFVLYLAAYCCHGVIGLICSVQLVPHIHYDPLAQACVANHRPPMMAAIWTFVLTYETLVFVLTLIKVIQHRASNQLHNPLMQSLHYGQMIYNVVIIAVRVFNLLIWNTLPPSLVLLGLFFIWAMITTLVTRMMLHLRKVASSNPQQSETSFLAETAMSTQIVWARHPPPWSTSRTVSARGTSSGATMNDAREGFILQTFREGR